MPLVQINLTDDEVLRVDALAEENKRTRKSEVHYRAMKAIAEAEAEKAAASPAPATPAQ